MKQPELGHKIQQLRQDKNLTQEELVERCKISVRTLQRIEAGEVTPRSYTIRSIFAGLDYNLDQISDALVRKSSIKTLQVAWIAGLIYVLLAIIEILVEIYRFESDLPSYFPFLYLAVKSVVLITFTLFFLGFAAAGSIFKNSLIRISAYLMIGSLAVVMLYDIISLFSGINEEDFLMVKAIESVSFGGIEILFGIALFRMSSELGELARIGGVLEVLVGALFLTVILALGGLILLMPANLIEIVILYQLHERIKDDL